VRYDPYRVVKLQRVKSKYFSFVSGKYLKKTALHDAETDTDFFFFTTFNLQKKCHRNIGKYSINTNNRNLKICNEIQNFT